MKSLIILLTFFSLNLLADDDKAQRKAQRIAERKAQASQRIDTKISHLNNLKSCINNATKKEEIKACRKKHKAIMKPLRDKWKAEKKQQKEKRRANREKRKAERMAKKASKNQ